MANPIPFLSGINLGQNPLNNAQIQNLPTASAPSSPVIGQVYYDTTLNALRTWSGSTWQGMISVGVTGITLNQPTSGITVTNNGVLQTGSASFTFAFSGLMASLASLGADGLMVNTGGTASSVTLTGTSNQVNITNGSGGGNPTFSLPQSIAATSDVTFNSR